MKFRGLRVFDGERRLPAADVVVEDGSTTSSAIVAAA